MYFVLYLFYLPVIARPPYFFLLTLFFPTGVFQIRQIIQVDQGEFTKFNKILGLPLHIGEELLFGSILPASQPGQTLTQQIW